MIAGDFQTWFEYVKDDHVVSKLFEGTRAGQEMQRSPVCPQHHFFCMILYPNCDEWFLPILNYDLDESTSILWTLGGVFHFC